MNYGVSFSLCEKVNVHGSEKLLLFTYVTEQAPLEGYNGTMNRSLRAFTSRPSGIFSVHGSNTIDNELVWIYS
ncbi:hypothetical protein SAMN04487970_100191 [Paenibacillus tianmuensis]|uniref:Uncharacterized protein n=1 Tax=Paenibacillus tianmuensis TaxID=624147 RepID=A0A1G4P5H7_9BACL|nr:hypothetical protein SAMN04487970_100191 [Paenibacillus tianmuensis]